MKDITGFFVKISGDPKVVWGRLLGDWRIKIPRIRCHKILSPVVLSLPKLILVKLSRGN